MLNPLESSWILDCNKWGLSIPRITDSVVWRSKWRYIVTHNTVSSFGFNSQKWGNTTIKSFVWLMLTSAQPSEAKQVLWPIKDSSRNMLVKFVYLQKQDLIMYYSKYNFLWDSNIHISDSATTIWCLDRITLPLPLVIQFT